MARHISLPYGGGGAQQGRPRGGPRVTTATTVIVMRGVLTCLPSLLLFASMMMTVVVRPALGDFQYVDFESIIGLDLRGSASTSSCDQGKRLAYRKDKDGNVLHGNMDDSTEGILPTTQEDDNFAQFQEVETDTKEGSARVSTETALLGHRDVYGFAPNDGCRTRIRLTPSEPSKAGAIWHARPLAVFLGFETKFTFQITDQSRTCTLVKDRQFSTSHHQSCMVHGGDGLAFVLHGAPSRSYAIGSTGEGLGYGGIVNSISVEFDSWYNPYLGDMFKDHVTVQTMGKDPDGNSLPNHPGDQARLVAPKATPVADGQVHEVKIRYVPYIDYSLVQYFSGVEHLTTFLKDNEENRRVGTFVVYVDNMDVPLLAFPINLSYVLDLGEGTAWAGFTSSTGRKWQKHDVISWYFCEDHKQCAFNLESKFDYHRENKIFGRRLRRLAREEKVIEARKAKAEEEAKKKLEKEVEAEEVSAVKEEVRREAEEHEKAAAGGGAGGNPVMEEGVMDDDAEAQQQQQQEMERVHAEDGGDAYVDDDGVEVVEV